MFRNYSIIRLQLVHAFQTNSSSRHMQITVCSLMSMSLPINRRLLIASLLIALQKRRSPCLSIMPQENIQSKCDTWFMMNRQRLLNCPLYPKDRVLIPNKYSEKEINSETCGLQVLAYNSIHGVHSSGLPT